MTRLEKEFLNQNLDKKNYFDPDEKFFDPDEDVHPVSGQIEVFFFHAY